jgi:hypothetical protein
LINWDHLRQALHDWLFGESYRIEITELEARIKAEYNLDASAPVSLRMLPYVSYVTSLDEIKSEPKAQVTSGVASSRTDTYTVPAGVRWRVKNIGVERFYAGLERVRMNINGNTGPVGGSAGTQVSSFNIVCDINLGAGDQVIVESYLGVFPNDISSAVIYDEVIV